MRSTISIAFMVVLVPVLGCLKTSPNSGPGGSASPGGGGSGSGGGSAPQSCSTPGATQSCCGAGTRTCAGIEFPTWSPCLAADGTVLTCQPDCASGEFSSCDGGMPVPPGGCAPGEFGPGCDGGTRLPPEPLLCKPGTVNNEPEILAAFSPANGQSVGLGGQIKVWVNDENAPFIAPNEQVNTATGQITTPGDRAAKAPDGYLWEPALYIAPQSAENGGTPHFPVLIKGTFNNNLGAGPNTIGAAMDPLPAGTPALVEQFTAEYVWDVNLLGLKPGQYIAEFVIWDGDEDRGVGCVTITIQQQGILKRPDLDRLVPPGPWRGLTRDVARAQLDQPTITGGAALGAHRAESR